MGAQGRHLCTPPHTVAETLESLRFCLGRLGDGDAPWGVGYDGFSNSPPHGGGNTRVLLVLPGLWGIG